MSTIRGGVKAAKISLGCAAVNEETLRPGFNLTPGFYPDWKKRNPGTKIPPNVQTGSLNCYLKRVNLPPQNQPEISQIDPG